MVEMVMRDTLNVKAQASLFKYFTKAVVRTLRVLDDFLKAVVRKVDPLSPT
jgi:hypothetical protein